MKEVSEHSHYESCWLVVKDKVYDVTQFMHEHPGGLDIVMENAGRDATITFDDKGHSGMAYKLLSKYYIGDLIEADKIDKWGRSTKDIFFRAFQQEVVCDWS